MPRLIVYPYKVGSQSARQLARALNTVCVYPDRRYQPKPGHVIIGWGAGTNPTWLNRSTYSDFLNRPERVSIASNKRHCFEWLNRHEVPTVEWTASREVAKQWLKDKRTVIGRSVLTGHSGKGIILLESSQDFVDLPLYTLYKKKMAEFRVHVMRGNVFDIQHKKQRRETEVDHKIRSHENGWVYCREDIEYPIVIEKIAKQSLNAVGLDFGAVDIIWNQKEDKCYVLEINTAPGLEGTTLDNYIREFRNVLKGK